MLKRKFDSRHFLMNSKIKNFTCLEILPKWIEVFDTRDTVIFVKCVFKLFKKTRFFEVISKDLTILLPLEDLSVGMSPI